MRFSSFWLVSVAFVAGGCQCTRSEGPNTVEGEVRWQFETAQGMFSDSTGELAFPLTDMGVSRDKVIFVQNAGRAPFTMTEFAKISGSAVTLGLFTEPNPAFTVKWDPTHVVNPTELEAVTVVFSPPVTADPLYADYASVIELRAQGAPAAQLTLTGRALAPECAVPEVIDFGSIPVRSYQDFAFTLRNVGMTPITVSSTAVAGAPELTFLIGGLDEGGTLNVAPGESPEALITFKPRDPGDYAGEVKFRRSASCPERTVQLRGRAVPVCLSWSSYPSDDLGASLQFGNVFPGSAGPGTVTFQNACSFGVQVAQLHTSDPIFAITNTSLDLTSLVVPPAERDASKVWVSGTGEIALEFRPNALGAREGQLVGITSAAWQPNLTIGLKAFGGGPRISVDPPVLAFGQMGFVPGASPRVFVERRLAISNAGTIATPADPRMNLRLGVLGEGPIFSTIRAISGTPDELCFGDWDTVTDTCAGTLSASGYDSTVGIEAGATTPLRLPVRVVPKSEGRKEWELTLFSNDSLTPSIVIRITADALIAPPCDFSVAPVTLDFGTLQVPAERDLQFTFTNHGTEINQRCFINGLELDALSSDTFTVQSTPPDFLVPFGESRDITVRAKPLRVPTMATAVSGTVRFNVSAPSRPQQSVALSAMLASNCITFTPSPVSFADTELECATTETNVVITNTCPSAVDLKSTTLSDPGNAPPGSGSCTTTGGCAQFSIGSAPATGLLASGASRTAKLRFRPYTLGPATGELTVTFQQGAQLTPYIVALRGSGRPRTSPTCNLTAMCPGPMTVNANTTVTLTPSVMATGAVTCAWTPGARPSTSSGTFGSPTSCTGSSYFADVAGTHHTVFTATDVTGNTSQCETEITVKPVGDLWVELTWDKNNDVDLHLLHPLAGNPQASTSWRGLYDCHFSNKTPNWLGPVDANPNLDHDSIQGTGPENTRIDKPSQTLTYTIGAHMFNYSAMSPVTSTVKVYCGGQLVATRTLTMSVSKGLWVVGSVKFDTGTTCTFTPNDTVLPSAGLQSLKLQQKPERE